jgi:predicted dehydrogenase
MIESGNTQNPSMNAGAGASLEEASENHVTRSGRQLHFGVIGYGYWGPQLARNLARSPLGAVTHIADLSEERRQAARLEHPASRVTASAEEVLASSVDAVVVATPVRTHYPLARAAIEQGKHVLVEKPLAATVLQAKSLVALADRSDRVLMTGHTFLYNPAVEQLRQLIQTGTLGQVHYADAIRVNLGLFQQDINVIWDLAPHDLSILNYVLGALPLRISAHGGAYVRADVHDVAHLLLYYPAGVLAHIHISWLSPSKIRRFTVVGSQRMVIYDDVEATEKIRIFDRGVDAPDHTSTFGEFQLSYRYGDIVSPHIHWSEPLAIECRHFAEAILQGKRPRSDAREGLRIVRILEAASNSLAANGAMVEIEHDEAGAAK